MKKIIHANSIYFICLSLFFIAGGLLFLSIEKPDAILYFNEHRSYWGDIFFTYGTKLGEEAFYVIFVLLFLFKKVRHAILIGLIGFIVMGVSFGLKSLFAIDRPVTFFRKNGLEETINFIEGVDVHSAATSFPSGHSMSAFALYSLLIFLLPNRKRYVLPLFLIALIVAVSRVYLVQHFWEDVYVGGLIGALLALLAYAVNLKFEDKLDKPLFAKKENTKVP